MKSQSKIEQEIAVADDVLDIPTSPKISKSQSMGTD